MADRPDELADDTQWRTAGDRIQTLLDASAAGGAVAHERAEQLVREVTDLYGAALERIMRMASAEAELVERLVADDLVASLLLVHGLHPHPVERRVCDALDTVRPYLGSHGGDVHLLEVADRDNGPTVRLQFSGSCRSCPSSSVTLELAVEDAVRAAAPEICSIEVVTAQADPTPGVIAAESLLSRVHRDRRPAVWQPVPHLAELAPGEVGGFRVAGTTLLACRVGDELFTYHDRCGSCAGSLAGAALHRQPGTAGVLLRCPRCRALFDVVHAGSGVETGHLEPIPLLVRDGVLSVALAAEGGGLMGGAYDVLARIRANRSPAPVTGERCEMCAEPIADEHQHVVNVEGRQLMCVCRGCYLLFTDTSAALRYRAVPDRYLTFADFGLGRREWELLAIPVGLAFFFFNSALGRTVAFYPGPAGATESQLDLAAWTEIRGADPRVDLMAPDTEALIVRVPDDESQPPDCHLVPIDACYEFVGRLRMLWHGFDGGQQVRSYIEEFFGAVTARSKVVAP